MRTITIDLDTGKWLDPKPQITPTEGARVASSVLPGWPSDLIDEAYSDWLSEEPEISYFPPGYDETISNLDALSIR